ncbi:MAG: LD-carboxypeptidase [Deltaproteobacteria bacterium]|nr:LD-carboxypeptidase [Deltaproteobacteria bacterium]
MARAETRKLLLPQPLTEGDIVGVAAPAGPFDETRFKAGLTRLESMGLIPRYSPDIFKRDGYLAGSDRSRAETINTLLADESVKAVFCARGGYGAMRILDRIDLELIQNKPRIMIGFSDVTALLLALHQAVGLVTFHGPVVTSLGQADKETVSTLKKLLFRQSVFPLIVSDFRVMLPGRAEGPLMGGNLTILIHLLATPTLPDLDGAILFLEDTGESPYRLDRMLTALRLSGTLERSSGLILGQFVNCGSSDEVNRVLERNLTDFHGPVLADFPVGHGARNITLPIGPNAMAFFPARCCWRLKVNVSPRILPLAGLNTAIKPVRFIGRRFMI